MLGIREASPQDWDGGPYVADDAPSTTAVPEASPQDATGSPGSTDAAPVGVSEPAAAPALNSVALWAEWPMPNPPSLTELPNPQKYDTSMAGLVIDRVTRLQWQAAPGPGGTAAPLSWAEAGAYCAGLATAGGGWRLPSRIELVSILDYTQPAPTLDSAAFAGSPAGGYWTASSLAGAAGIYWVIDFGGAPNVIASSATVLSDGGPARYYARCVR